MSVICDEDDEILIPDPGFPTYYLAATYCGIRPIFYPLSLGRCWNPAVEDIVRLIGPRTRGIIINSPSNPLGVVLDDGVIEAIVRLAAARGIVCIQDETYRHLVYGSAPKPLPHHDHCLYLHSLSKEAAVPGMRIGALIGAPEIVAKVADFNSLFYSCLPKFVQRAAAQYLSSDNQFYQRLRAKMPKRIALVDEILAGCPALNYVVPNAAFYVYADISRTGLDAETFTRALLAERHVAVCPGTYFGPSGANYVRLSLAGDERDVLEGCARLVDFAQSRFYARSEHKHAERKHIPEQRI
jgi:aspartate/methionine/tyrosine aminotransferase